MTSADDGFATASESEHRETVVRALLTARERGEPLRTGAGMSLEEGYRVQDEMVRRLVAAGERVAGYKIGLTTRAARAEFGTHEPGRGHLLESDIRRSPAIVPAPRFPLRYEVELAARIRVPVTTDEKHLDVVRKLDVAPALELIASRWHPPTADIGLWAADNGLSTSAVVGEFVPAEDVLGDHAIATSCARVERCLEPWKATEALTWLVRHLQQSERVLPAGTIVLTGAIIGPEPVTAGETVRASIEGVGTLSASFL